MAPPHSRRRSPIVAEPWGEADRDLDRPAAAGQPTDQRGGGQEPPGPFAVNYGLATPLVTIAAHVVYGAVLGLTLHPT